MSEPEQKWMLLIVQMTFSGENCYVGHTSKILKACIHIGAVTDSLTLSSNIVFIHTVPCVKVQLA